MEKYLTAKEAAEFERKLEEIEAWAAGLLDKCTKARSFLQNATANVPVPVKEKYVLSVAERAEIAAKQRMRMLRKSKKN